VAPARITISGTTGGSETHAAADGCDSEPERAQDGPKEGVVLHAVAAAMMVNDLGEKVIVGEGEGVGGGVVKREALERHGAELPGHERAEEGQRGAIAVTGRGQGLGGPTNVLEIAVDLIGGVCCHGRIPSVAVRAGRKETRKSTFCCTRVCCGFCEINCRHCDQR